MQPEHRAAGPAPGVRVHFASINTKAVTELTIRTMQRYAGYPFELVVGDCGSTDGSLAMLRAFEQAGRLRLEVAPGGRRHPDWLDEWYATCPTRYAVFCDSDVEFRRSGWLRDMVEAAERSGAALVATRIQARGGVPYTHPVTGAQRILAERPEMWLLLIDVDQTRPRVSTSFAYCEETRASDGAKLAYDTGAAFFRAVVEAGLPYVEMPPEFRRAYLHYGSMSWQRSGDRRMPLAKRLKQAVKRARVAWGVRRERRADARRGAPG